MVEKLSYCYTLAFKTKPLRVILEVAFLFLKMFSSDAYTPLSIAALFY